MTDSSLHAARALDERDELRGFRERFSLPSGLVYLDGNSLGALPKATMARLAQVTEQEWGRDLIGSWNSHDWVNAPANTGAKIAQLIGAAPGQVVVTDSTSVNLFRLVLSALEMQTGRTEVLSEAGNFPTDLYVCEGAARAFGRGAHLTVVPRGDVVASISNKTAVVLLTHVHYKTAEMHDMVAVTAAAHAHGALILWDLSHSAGAVPVALDAAGADFAVGCGYKYLNGGPGAPAFLYVASRHHGRAVNHLSGWFGHSRPFDFIDAYEAASGITQFLAGTPQVLATAALDVGVSILLEAGVERLAAKSRQLTDYFITLVESRCAGHGLTLATPRDAARRGSHVSFAHPNGYEIMQALIADGVVGDFRAPDILRFGFTPLYTRFEDVWLAVDTLRQVLESERWREPRFAERSAVT